MRGISSASSGFVIDTGALLCALVWNYVQEANIPDSKRAKLAQATIPTRYQSRPRFGREYLTVLGRRRLVTVSYAVAEIQGLIRGRAKLSGEDYRRFWDISLRYLEQNVAERPLLLRDLCADSKFREAVLRIGPTDAAMIALAYDLHVPVLTLDQRTLAQCSRAFQVSYLLPDEIL